MIARLLGGDADDLSPDSVVGASLSALHDACNKDERNRDAFIPKNMAQVRARAFVYMPLLLSTYTFAL